MEFAPAIIILAAALWAGFVWWAGTDAVLRLVRRSERLSEPLFALLGFAAALAFLGLWALRETTGPMAAGASFVLGVVLWAWNEALFLTGCVVGPNRRPCPPDAKGWARFRLAAATLMHHELALAATGAAAFALTFGGANMTGAYAFAVLWVMRLSSKLNLFLGVRNLGLDFLPKPLDHLSGYLRRASWNPLMAVSLIAGAALTGLLIQRVTHTPDAHGQAAFGLLAALAALGVLEHLFLVLPIPDMPFWRWARLYGGRRHVSSDVRKNGLISTRQDDSVAPVRRAAEGDLDSGQAMRPDLLKPISAEG